ncbi:hypothetical protein MIR68_002338 [Amoeboaphelidium protococcarum]|nr:hypothetical protein MIR68_002338 [Amoeboaphelidium protococcarum]
MAALCNNQTEYLKEYLQVCLKDFVYAECFYGFSALYFRTQLLQQISQFGGDASLCSLDVIQDLMEELLFEKFRGRVPFARLSMSYNGIMFFMIKKTSETPGHNYTLCNGVMLYNYDASKLGDNVYFGVARVSPCSQLEKNEAQYRQVTVLNSLMKGNCAISACLLRTYSTNHKRVHLYKDSCKH